MGQGSQAGGGYGGQAPAYGGQPAAVTMRLTRTQVEDSLGRLFKGEPLVSHDDALTEASTPLSDSLCLAIRTLASPALRKPISSICQQPEQCALRTHTPAYVPFHKPVLALQCNPPATECDRESELCLLCAEISEDGPRALMPAAPEIVKPLYPHQQEALAWMVNRENTSALPPFWEPFA